MKDIRTAAKERMNGACRACPVCDGRVCAGEVPGMGGLGAGEAFKDNVRSLAEISLNMRLIHEARDPDPAATWLGLPLAMPVVAAPLGGMFNFGQPMPEEAYVEAVLSGCRAAGVIGCTGDGAPPEVFDAAALGLAAVSGHGIPFIKPWEGAELEDKLERALATGCPALGMDIDAAGLVTLRKMGRPVGPKTLRELAAVIRTVHAAGRRFIVKGVMTVADARLAVEAGADAVCVSNHGGRVMAAAPGTARALPAIAAAVGRDVSILVDGGVRTGADVFKMLALGAHAVGIGRPVSLAAIGGGGDGVAGYFSRIRDELVQTMILTGCGDIGAITPEALFRA